MFNMKALSTLYTDSKFKSFLNANMLQDTRSLTSFTVLPTFLVPTPIFTQIHNFHIFNVAQCFYMYNFISNAALAYQHVVYKKVKNIINELVLMT